MARNLRSERIEIDGFFRAMEYFWGKSWSDGLPVVPPTERRVQDFLDYVGLEPNRVVAAHVYGIRAEGDQTARKVLRRGNRPR